MNVTIVGIFDRGIANRERLHFRVLKNTNLKFFVVFDTTVVPTGGVSTIPSHVYWFTDRPVNLGDNIFLFTGPGAPSSAPNSIGTTDHFIYWNQLQTLWGHQASRAVLMEIIEWATSPP